MKARKKLEAGVLMPNNPAKRDEAILNAGGNRVESVLFDFANDGGAIGDINFGRLLPLNAIVVKIIADEQTALTSGGSATVQLKAGAINLSDAEAFDTGFTGIDNIALVSSADGVKIAVESELKISIATAALTAGKLRFFVEYYLPND